jgi:hypothetical protein
VREHAPVGDELGGIVADSTRARPSLPSWTLV